MSNPYEKVNGGRLTFKGGSLATRKAIDKKKKKHKKKKDAEDESQPSLEEAAAVEGAESGGNAYTIDAAKKMKYEELFPVEAKKFKYDPKNPKATSVEQALDDRVKKKADRYCK
ncbi:hypothetical protein CCACVL1_01952 [Corchorus capsularis]|uniref:Uncharacterized protein n=1 Tax=Corchorus capsularis TaxID=210143 RepID=A0A1R3KE25_COCAP|nr:hypothetical protein CCACVL1_01952 [Corchorus capsularis]